LILHGCFGCSGLRRSRLGGSRLGGGRLQYADLTLERYHTIFQIAHALLHGGILRAS
jgi:hypothetical protein